MGLRFVHFPGPSSSGDWVFGECGCCDLSPPLFLPLSFLRVQLAHLLRQMLTIQNPKKSWLAKKPACSLVDTASLGLRLPPSGSGCLSPEGEGLQPAISVQSFVPCAGLAVSEDRAGFSHGRYPTVWFASPNYFAQIALRVFRPDSYSQRCSPRRASLPSPGLLMADAGVCAASLLGELP